MDIVLKKQKAFSIIEILVALIVVSVITAALAPVITKKLTASSITVLGGNGGGGVIAGEEDTQENLELKKQLCEMQGKYWDSIEKKCKDCELEGCAKCSLSGPYKCDECSDSGFVFDGEQCVGDPCTRYGALTVNNLCVMARNVGDDSEYYPNIPNTQGSCKTATTTAGTCDTGDDGYSGCKRTTCNRAGALTACWNLEIKGLKGWRLPTLQEAKEFDTATLNLCNSSKVGTTTQCAKGNSWPYALWTISSTKCESSAWHTYTYYNGTWQEMCSYANGGADPGSHNSVRCVISRCKAIDNHCQECNDKKCTLCDYDYELNQYGKCAKCEEGYAYDEDTKKCIKSPCSKYDAVEVGNICVSKRNYGDSSYYIYASPTSGSCTQNKIFSNYTNENGDYSGSPRTLCNRRGAFNVCGNLTVRGLSGWRLPDLSEMATWNQHSLNKANGGLMLCSSNQITGVSWCAQPSESYQPHAMWSGSNVQCVSDAAWNTYTYYNGSWYETCSYANGGASPSTYNSVRCVIDKCRALDIHCTSCTNEKCVICDKDYHPNENGECVKCEDGTLFNQETGQCELDTCLKYDAVAIGDLCVSRRNYGDSNLYTYKDPSSGSCKHAYVSESWSSTNGSYSGSPRTLCNRAAAQVVCIDLDVNGLTGWRLPSQTEQANWYNYSTNLGDGGLMICSKSSGGHGNSHCSGSGSGYAPHAFWSSSGSTCQSDAYYNYAFNDTYASICSFANGGSSPSDFNSVRCVIDKCRSIDNCVECNGTTCTKCEKDYIAKNGRCEACPDGQLYNSASNKCEVDECLKYDAITVEGLCVQRKNYGDSSYYTYRAPTSGTCHNAHSTISGNRNGSYLASPRMLCNRAAALVVCNDLEIQGLSGWRLPTPAEMLRWGVYTDRLGDGGLMLCSQKQVEGVSYCPKSNAGGSTGYPFAIWSNTGSTCTSGAYYTYAYNSVYEQICSYDNGGAAPASFNSVRCVIEKSKLP